MSLPDALGLVNRTVDQIRFDECIDAGGFGTVYRGRHGGRDEPVAIKCLRVARLSNLTDAMRASTIRRFGEETKILHHLSHGTRDIVRCLAAGQLVAPATGEPVLYMVLEWLEGRTLSADLAERRERGLPGRTLRDTLDLVESAAHAIAYAHTQGIIHRDIKPANLMLTRTSQRTEHTGERPEQVGGLRLKVLDFGLAKILCGELGSGNNVATADGVQLVSVAYCAPEQLSAHAGEIGPWTDIYSLALVLLEVMRGERIPHPMAGPIRASSFGLSIPPAVEDLLARALSQNPLERPANANIFWSSLRELTRQNTPPVTDASALAATAFAGETAAAIARVRAATAPGDPSRSGAPGSAPVIAGQPSPFTGTMIMVTAPSGALHMLKARSEPPAAGSTAPLAPPLKAPANALPVVSPHAIAAGVALPTSPLAASLGPGAMSPVAVAKPPLAAPLQHQRSTPQGAEPPLPHAQPTRSPSVPPARTTSVPPMLPQARSGGSGIVIIVLVLLVLAVLAAAGWLAFRPH